jgi:protein-tyrosine phosphatase
VPLTVLIVCTGNISRSPMTELLLRASADPGAGLTVSSAGVHALVGQPMDDAAATAMVQLGFNPTQHRARQFEPAMAAAADLILTAERYHLETVLKEVPTALRRTFTIKEFARIAPYLRPGPPERVIAQASVVRGLVPRPANPRTDDVADPHGQSVSVNRATAAELTKAVDAVVGALGVARKRAAGGNEPARRPKPYKR